MPRLVTYRLPFTPRTTISPNPAPYHADRNDLKYCIDFAMAPGTPVRAARSGEVISVKVKYAQTLHDPAMAWRANKIVIRHIDGTVAWYVHLAYRSAYVKVGDHVYAGRVIALSGQVGYATYPHLHFGVYDRHDKNIPVIFRIHPRWYPQHKNSAILGLVLLPYRAHRQTTPQQEATQLEILPTLQS